MSNLVLTSAIDVGWYLTV